MTCHFGDLLFPLQYAICYRYEILDFHSLRYDMLYMNAESEKLRTTSQKKKKLILTDFGVFS